MHDIGGQIMLAGGDENLVACEAEAAIGLGYRFGSEQTQIRAAMRFGQTHGAGPLTRDQLRQVERLLLWRAMGMQAFIRAMREAGVHGPGLIG